MKGSGIGDQGSATPPRLADWLLRRVLPLGKRGDSIRGDLIEEFRALQRPPDPRSPIPDPRIWYWQQAIRLTLRYFTQPAPVARLSPPRRSPMLMDLTSDLRTAIRSALRHPGTSSLIVFTLAVAIAAATVGFAFADLALLRGLPVDQPSRVVSTFLDDHRGPQGQGRVSAPDFLDYRARSTTLERMSVFREGSAALITDGQSRTLHVAYATDDFFAAMGQPAVAGRTLQIGDDRAGAAPVVVLSHAYWQQDYSGRADAIGRQIQIGRQLFTIVGVITPEMEFANLAEIELWLPFHVAADSPRDLRNLRLVARLRDGVPFDRAAAEMAAIGDALASEYPDSNGGWKVRLVPVRELTGGDSFWIVLAMFMLSIALLMAIATANVSNLVMVRTAARARELAVRIALGARRGRLVRQLLTEGALLSVVAAALSVPAAWAGLRGIGALSSEVVFQQLTIDNHELAFVAMLAFICPLFFTLAPARMLARPDMRQVLASAGGRGATRSNRGRGALVIAQVALAVILLTVSGLAVRSMALLYGSPTGMNTERLLIFGLNLNDAHYPRAEEARAALAATQDGLRSIPGADLVATMSTLPILGGETLSPITIPGQPAIDGQARPVAVVTQVSANTGTVLGLALLAGTWWNEGESAVAVLGRETAIRLFGTPQLAIDRQIGVTLGSEVKTARIVGVASDVVAGNRTEAMPARVWVPLAPDTRHLSFVVKASGDPAALASSVRTVVAQTTPAVPVEYLQTFDDELSRAASSDYVVIGMLGGFSLLALLLASTGLFGVVSYTVSLRTQEFGTRMALGATAWDVIRLVGRQALLLLAVGLLLGLGGGVGVASAMGSVLYGVSATDPLTLTSIVALLAFVTLVATALPAWRASRIDPVVALRAE